MHGETMKFKYINTLHMSILLRAWNLLSDFPLSYIILLGSLHNDFFATVSLGTEPSLTEGYLYSYLVRDCNINAYKIMNGHSSSTNTCEEKTGA